jgi:transposase
VEEIPKALSEDEGFMAAWAEWVKYRRETKKKTARSTAAKQLKKLAGVGAEAAIAAINRSIEHGWAGLFPETQHAKSQPNNSHALPEAQGWTLEEIQQVEASNAN